MTKQKLKYVRVTQSHVTPANGNGGFLLKEVTRGLNVLSKVVWYEPKTKSYRVNWFNRRCVRDK